MINQIINETVKLCKQALSVEVKFVRNATLSKEFKPAFDIYADDKKLPIHFDTSNLNDESPSVNAVAYALTNQIAKHLA
jgi:hypothetical protein